MPTFKVYVDGREKESMNTTNKVRLREMFDRANEAYKASSKAKPAASRKRERRFLNDLDELNRYVEATANGGRPLVVKFCPPSTYYASIVQELQAQFPGVIIKNCEFERENAYPEEKGKVGNLPNFVSFVDGAEYEILKGGKGDRIAEMIQRAVEGHSQRLLRSSHQDSLNAAIDRLEEEQANGRKL